MPQLNRKLFVWLLLITITLGGGLFAVHYVQSGRAADALLWQAEHHAEQGKTKLAVSYFRQYLELKPDDTESIVSLCELLEAKGMNARQAGQVLFLYEKALRAKPDYETARRKAVEVCLLLGRYHDAITHLNELMPAHPEDGELYRQFAICQNAAGEFDKARDALKKAVEFSPDDVRAYELLASLEMSEFKQPPAAKETLDRMVSSNDENPEALLVRARYMRSLNDLERCEEDIQKLLLIDPENVEGVLLLSEVMQARGDFHGTREALNDAIALHRKDIRLYRGLSWLEMCAGNRPASIACLKRGIEELPDEVDLLTPLADLLIQDGELAEAKDLLAKLEARSVEPSQVAYLQARVEMGEKNWASAAEMLEALRSRAVDLPGLGSQVNLLLAKCHQKLADPAAQLTALKRALEIDPKNLSARLAVGNLHLNAGRLDAAIAEYEQVSQSTFAPVDVNVLLGRMKIGQARNSKADAAEWARVADYVAKVRREHPDSPRVTALATELLTAQGKYLEADKLLSEEVGRRPGDADLWVELAELRRDAFGYEAAFEILDQAKPLAGDHVEFRLARARLWADGVGKSKMEQVADAGNAIDRFPEGDQAKLLYGLADIYDGMHDEAEMKRVYRAIADRQPKNTAVRLELFELAKADNDAATMEKIRAELTAMGEPGRIPLAVTIGNVENLTELAREHPGDVSLRTAMGRICERSGDIAGAAEHFAVAFDLDRSRMSRLRELVAFLLRHDKEDQARKRLVEAFRDPRVKTSRFRTLFASATAAAPDEQFARCAEWVKPLTDADPQSRAWIGDLFQRRGDSARAEANHRAAVAMAPARPEARLRLASSLIDAGSGEKLNGSLDEARAALKPPVFAMLSAQVAVLAREAGINDWKPAFSTKEEESRFARAMLRVFMRREQVSEAKAFLDAFAMAPGHTPEDMTWAKRNAALLGAIDGDAEQRRAAVAQLRQLAAQGANSPEDRRAHATVLAMAYRHLDGDQRRDVLKAAIDSMASVAEDDSVTPTDLSRLASLYRKAGDRESLLRTLKQLAEREPRNPGYASAYLEELLDDGKMGEAEEWAKRLESEHGDNFSAVKSLAKYRHMRGEASAVLAITENYVRGVEPGSNEAPTRLRHVAGLLDELSQFGGEALAESRVTLAAAAAARYAACLPGQPEAAVPFAGLLARTGKPDEALTLLVRSRDRISDRALVAGGLDLLRSGKAGPRHFNEVRGWLDAILKEAPGSLPMRLSLGEFHTLAGEYPAAEREFRTALQADPGNVVALNNLAWVLAPDPARTPQALEYVDRAIEAAGRNAELLDTRARALIARGSEGDYDKAVADLNEALGEGQTSLRYFHLAVANLKRAEPDGAIEAFRKANACGLESRMVHPTDMPAYRALSARVGS